MVSSSSQKKTFDSLLASNLTKLTIPSSSSSPATHHDFEFSDLFGPPISSPSASLSFQRDPLQPQLQVIHNRPHSFVGPSPHFAPSSSLPFHQELDSQSEEEDGGEADDGTPVINGVLNGKKKNEILNSDGNKVVGKIGPADFEILRVVGKGAFGKAFPAKKTVDDGGDSDEIYAMKVMRKDIIIKKNHVDYMKAERHIVKTSSEG